MKYDRKMHRNIQTNSHTRTSETKKCEIYEFLTAVNCVIRILLLLRLLLLLLRLSLFLLLSSSMLPCLFSVLFFLHFGWMFVVIIIVAQSSIVFIRSFIRRYCCCCCSLCIDQLIRIKHFTPLPILLVDSSRTYWIIFSFLLRLQMSHAA